MEKTQLNMADLIEFPATSAVLQRLAEDVKAGYVDSLIRNGRPTKYGKDRLADTVTTVVTVNEKSFTVSLKLNRYWEYVEEGTGPARGRAQYWPRPSAILNWIEVKPVIPRPDGNGRIPSPKSLAFLIGRKIHEVGTKGTHDLQKTKDAVLPQYYDKIADALRKDVGNYVKALFL